MTSLESVAAQLAAFQRLQTPELNQLSQLNPFYQSKFLFLSVQKNSNLKILIPQTSFINFHKYHQQQHLIVRQAHQLRHRQASRFHHHLQHIIWVTCHWTLVQNQVDHRQHQQRRLTQEIYSG